MLELNRSNAVGVWIGPNRAVNDSTFGARSRSLVDTDNLGTLEPPDGETILEADVVETVSFTGSRLVESTSKLFETVLPFVGDSFEPSDIRLRLLLTRELEAEDVPSAKEKGERIASLLPLTW